MSELGAAAAVTYDGLPVSSGGAHKLGRAGLDADEDGFLSGQEVGAFLVKRVPFSDADWDALRTRDRALLRSERARYLVGTEHVLLALLDDPAGIAGIVFDRIGVTDPLRAA